MNRFHIHISVSDIRKSVAFYTILFAADPTVLKSDYAKWLLDDPRVNFAISTHGDVPGLNHLGIQAETEEDLAALKRRLTALTTPVLEEGETECCYSQSDKAWVADPGGLAWETYRTMGEARVFSSATQERATPCCVPASIATPVSFLKGR